MADLRTLSEKLTENKFELIGKIAFLVGVIFAIVGGIWGGKAAPTNDTVVLVLIIAGILIGLLNITAKEAPVVLVAVIALLVLAIWGASPAYQPIEHLSTGLAENVVGIVDSFGILMAPAAIIISIKAVIAAASPGD
jgi:hypothetical protein